MNRNDILSHLRERRWEIANRFAVERLGLFGSAARDELRDDSDVDVLVAFRGKATLDSYISLKTYLEELLGRKVDLVTETGLKPRAKSHVERDLIRVP